jgi:hypothetical protein
MVLRSLEGKRLILDSARGPEIVARRILSMLQEMDLSGHNSVDWVLNVNSEESWKRLSLNAEKLVLGPNIEFEKPFIKEKLYQIGDFKILAPSAWVIPILQERLKWFRGGYHIFPSDIDLNFWKPPKNSVRKQILVYRKHDVLEDDFNNVIKICKMLGLRYKVVTYGRYTRKSFRRILRKSRIAVWLGTTESQGLALLECWAMDVPSLIRIHDSFEDAVTDQVFESSSAPYLTRECGEEIYASDLNMNSFSNFLNQSIDKSPREYVLSEFSPTNSFEKLQTILTD